MMCLFILQSIWISTAHICKKMYIISKKVHILQENTVFPSGRLWSKFEYSLSVPTYAYCECFEELSVSLHVQQEMTSWLYGCTQMSGSMW